MNYLRQALCLSLRSRRIRVCLGHPGLVETDESSLVIHRQVNYGTRIRDIKSHRDGRASDERN
jgi:hypothetical protein